METCTSFDGIPTNCPVLTVQDMDSMNNCRQANKIDEIVEDACTSFLLSSYHPFAITHP